MFELDSYGKNRRSECSGLLVVFELERIQLHPRFEAHRTIAKTLVRWKYIDEVF